MEEVLQIIANTLLINLQTVKKEGLLLGKLGIALFLYKYSIYVNDKDYGLFSDQYIEEILVRMNTNSPADISDGIAGIGLGINYLIENKLVETEEDDNILEDLDVYIKKLSITDFEADIDADIPIFSKGTYFMARKNNVEIQNIIREFEEFHVSFDSTFVLPLSYLNSLLYFFSKAIDLNIEIERCKKILFHFIRPQIELSLNSNLFLNSDTILLKEIVERTENINKIEWAFIYNYTPKRNNLLDYGTMYLLYGYKKDFELIEIKNNICDIIKDISPDNLGIHLGIAGLGLMLLD